MHIVGEKVQKFYNETPFPDYELGRFHSKAQLKARAYSFAKVLDRAIPEDASIIDIGTGTGQLSSFLSLRRKNVWGIDFSDSSLNKARALKEKLSLDSLTLRKVDILDQGHINAIGTKFDYVLCLGVLHHTGNAYGAFQNILRLVKPGSFIAIGLYNRYGRIPLKLRKLLIHTKLYGKKLEEKFIKLQIETVDDKERLRGWINDQYFHPHETVHTVGEVMRWFKNNGVRFLQTSQTETSAGVSEKWARAEGAL